MKLLGCGDIHIGAGADYGAQPGDRLRDQEDVLARVASVAFEEKVDAVLFAGDAFERRTPTPSELQVWRRFRDTFTEPGMPPLFAIAGNHDVAAPELPTGMEVVGNCARTPSVAVLDGGVSVAVLPWTPPSRIVAAAGGGDRDAIHERAAELLVQTAAGLREQVPDYTEAILLAHWSVAGTSLPNGLPVDQLREPVLNPEELNFDFAIFGHIHKAQPFNLAGTGYGLYVGSPMPLNFGEARDEHGVWIIDTETDVEPRFVPIESRRFVTVDIPAIEPTIDGEEIDETDCIAAYIAERFPLEDAVVKIRYRATEEQARRVDQAALRRLVADAGAHKLYAIQPEIIRSTRARAKGIDETIDERRALTEWYALQASAGQYGPLEQRHAGYLEAVGR